MGKALNLIGKRFGRLVVVSKAENGPRGTTRWFCHCDCGNELTVIGRSLTSGHTKSCGCLQKERAREYNTTHGCEPKRLYNIWQGMKSRGTNPNHVRAHRYIERGITVCDEWRNSFEAFRDWALANGYADDLTIERIDNNKGYYPENCRWATDEEQANNKENNVKLTINGKTQTLAQHVRDPEINVHNLIRETVRSRIERGQTPEEAFSAPVERAIVRILQDGTVEEFLSQADACRKTGTPSSTLSRWLTGKRTPKDGSRWMYADEFVPEAS